MTQKLMLKSKTIAGLIGLTIPFLDLKWNLPMQAGTDDTDKTDNRRFSQWKS